MGKRSKRAAGQQHEPERPSAVYYRLHTFLETIRVIKGYEDQLCTLLHAIKTRGGMGAEVETELRELLDEMPSAAYGQELQGVRTLMAEMPLPVAEAAPAPAAAPTRGATVAKPRKRAAKTG